MAHAAAPYPPAVARDVRRAGTINSTAFRCVPIQSPAKPEVPDGAASLCSTARRRAAVSSGEIATSWLAWTYPRPPNSTSPSAPRSSRLRNPCGSRHPATPPDTRHPGGTVVPCRPAGEFLATPVRRYWQTVTRVASATRRRRDPRALIDNDITDDLLSHARIAESQRRLPVQAIGVAVIDVRVQITACGDTSASGVCLAGSQHGKLQAPRRHLRSAPSAAGVRSNYPKVPRARSRTRLRPPGRHHDRPAGSRRSAGGRPGPVAERTGTAVSRASPPDDIGRNVHTEYR